MSRLCLVVMCFCFYISSVLFCLYTAVVHFPEKILSYLIGIYVWNYTHHLLATGGYATLKPYLLTLFKALRTCGHGEQTVFMCDLAHAVARGFMQSYIPDGFYKPVKRIENVVRGGAGAGGPNSPNKGRAATKLSNKNVAGKVAEPAAGDAMMASLKEACEIIEYSLGVTNGSNAQDVVPMDVRYQLIKSHVLCKGLMNQPLPKNYGHDSEDKESQGPMSRALFVLEALLLHTKGLMVSLLETKFRNLGFVCDI